MQDDFARAYQLLNAAQKQAVDTIDGPLMVLAGPGTGKTQLLATRVANILKTTDTLPQNILCLTFTESGAQAMRQRLGSLIGNASYDVRISTYHSFGSEIIREYPEYFWTTNLESGEDSRLERPIDDLTKLQIVTEIVSNLAYDDALRSARYYVKSVVDTLAECKKSLLTPDQLLSLAQENLDQITAITPAVQAVFPASARISSYKMAQPVFTHIAEALVSYADRPCLAQQAHSSLVVALEQAASTNKTTELTKWKNNWLTKNEAGDWEFVGRDTNEKIRSLARIYQLYQQALERASLYDFDDMILRTLAAFEEHPDLLFNLQERYQYILLDEFQDTNAAQFAIVKQLANHPVHEGRPNVMAVGDDDQAIYAFQGAEVSNMLQFIRSFREVAVINLTENYRSHRDILHVAHGIADQIESRLHHQLADITKTLSAASSRVPAEATIQRHEFASQADEYAWIAHRVAELISQGVAPHEIAVLSPKHSRLETLVPFLNHRQVAVAYEKRENILDTAIIRSLTLILQTIQAAAAGPSPRLDELLPQCLSLDFWQLPTAAIWQANWQRARSDEPRSWAEIALDNPDLRSAVLSVLQLGSICQVTALEYMLDFATGVTPVTIAADQTFTIPFKHYYFSDDQQQSHRQAYTEALAHLSVIRAKLRDYQLGSSDLLTCDDYLRFVDMYRQAEQPLINSHPIAQAGDAVQLMTAYKAKGLEFEHVFLLSVHEDIWGKKARGNQNKVGLPANLQYIRYAGSSEDELRRLFFVAITRAKHGLYLTSHSHTDSGKSTEPLKYLQEFDHGSGKVAAILPTTAAAVITGMSSGLAPHTVLELFWEQRHVHHEPDLRALLGDRLQKYRLSPTHLNTYIDLEHGGPQAFFLKTLLRFPQAPTPDGEFGSAIHATLDWLQKRVAAGAQPNQAAVLAEFSTQLQKRYLSPQQRDSFALRGQRALIAYCDARRAMLYQPSQTVKSEVDFASDGIVLPGGVAITGKIDRLEIDEAAKTIAIVDFKTGATHIDKRSLKYIRYVQQLYMYKILVEHSHAYKKYQVVSGRLEFVEPNRDGTISPPFSITYDAGEAARTLQLLQVVWQRIQQLNFDDVQTYSPDFAGSSAFIADLLKDQPTQA